MIIAQISDSHIEAPGVLTYGRFDAAASLARVVEAVNACEPQPDLVIHTGDLVHHGESAQYPPACEILARLKAPLVAIPGNHDRRERFAAAFAGAPWLPAEGPFLQYTVEDGPVRLVCLDTVEPGHAWGTLCPERIRWLDEQLRARPDRPTVIACHHPPIATGLTGSTREGLDRGGPDLAAILARNPQVQRIICGHAHRPLTGTFGGCPVWVAPATGFQFAAGFSSANTLSLIREPPGFSLHLWVEDAVTGPSLVSHHIPVGDFGEPIVLLKDGQRVLPS